MKLTLPAGLVLRKVLAAGLAAGALFVGSAVAVASTSLDPSDPLTGLVLLFINTFGPVLTAYLTKESKLLEAAKEGVEEKV